MAITLTREEAEKIFNALATAISACEFLKDFDEPWIDGDLNEVSYTTRDTLELIDGGKQ